MDEAALDQFVNGKSRSQGGYNVADICKFLGKKGLTRAEAMKLIRQRQEAKQTFPDDDPLSGELLDNDITTLTPAEREALAHARPIYKRWGYRQQGDDHARFELETHHVRGGRALQEYTDVLMRNLQQHCEYGQGMLPDDVLPKIKDPPDLDPALQKLLERFLSTGNTRQLVHALAAHPLVDHSISFVVYVVAARVLLKLAQGKFDEAREDYLDLYEAYDARLDDIEEE